MTVVVTGAAGFIGAHLVTQLAQRGFSVVGIDRRGGIPSAASAAIVADLADRADRADCAQTSAAEVDDALRSADLVYHLAAFPGVRATGRDADLRRRRDNIDATRRVLAAVPLQTPLVVASSSSVYGGSADQPSSEVDRVSPRGAYAASKVEVERMCARRVSAGGHVAVARPFTVAGEGQRPDMAIARWIDDATSGRPLTIYGSPSRTRDLTDVNDVVEGLIRMGLRGIRSTVNLGTGHGQRIGDMAAAVAGAVGVALHTVVQPAGAEEPPDTLADTRRCASLLGFVPKTDLIGLVQRQVRAAVAQLEDSR